MAKVSKPLDEEVEVSAPRSYLALVAFPPLEV